MSRYFDTIRSFSASLRGAAISWALINVLLVYISIFSMDGLHAANFDDSLILSVFWLALIIVSSLNLALAALTKSYVRLFFLVTTVVTVAAAVMFGVFGAVSIVLNSKAIVGAIFFW